MLQLVPGLLAAQRVVQFHGGGRNALAAQVQLLLRLAAGVGSRPHSELSALGGAAFPWAGLSPAVLVQQHVPIYDADLVGHRAKPKGQSPPRMARLWIENKIPKLHLPLQHGLQ